MDKLIVANWKMNGNSAKVAEDLALYALNPATNKPNVVLALPVLYLPIARQILDKAPAKLGLASQDVSKFASYGAYTGEVSSNMLQEFGVGYSIIGHSERRMFLHESTHTLVKKIDAAIMSGIIPIFCIGEEKAVRNSGKYIEVLTEQLELLHQIEVPVKELVVSYEPFWSIGTGVLPSNDEILEIMNLIHTFVQNYLPRAKVTVLYGGSVTGTNAKEILSMPEVGGVLVGGTSLNVTDFVAICSYI